MTKKMIDFLEFENDLLQDISYDKLQENINFLASFDKTSGTEGEKQACDYIIEKLTEYGVRTETIEFKSLLSHPISASLTILSSNKKVFKARPPSFSQSTPPGGISGSLIYIGNGSEEEFNKVDVFDKIVLANGLASPDLSWRAQQAGATALIAANPGDQIIRELITTTIWGTPTLTNSERLPKLSVISVTQQTGEYLQSLEDPQVIVNAETSTEWRTVRIPIAFISGTKSTEKFILIEGHYDSWYEGATDNSTGTTSKLELARVFHKHREKLNRNIRIAWWPGHSTGRYSGSTYYVDNNWQDLYENAIAHLNIDSPGCLDSLKYDLNVMAELEEFEKDIVIEQTGAEFQIERPSRNSDQSFYGLGIPALGASPKIFFGGKGQLGIAIDKDWWHTPNDLLDKVDIDLLVRDTRLYTTLIFRLCNTQILPFNTLNTLKDFLLTLEDIQTKSNKLLDLSKPIKYCKACITTATQFNSLIVAKIQSSTEKTEVGKLETALYEINNCLMRLCRILNPVLYTSAGKFEQDPAASMALLPGLQLAARLSTLEPQSGKSRFLKTQLIREHNRVTHAFHEVITLLNEKMHLIKVLLK